MENRNTRLLGKTIHIRNYKAGDFRKEVGKYVDSNNQQRDINSWALVKACRIRHNWPVRPLLHRRRLAIPRLGGAHVPAAALQHVLQSPGYQVWARALQINVITRLD